LEKIFSDLNGKQLKFSKPTLSWKNKSNVKKNLPNEMCETCSFKCDTFQHDYSRNDN